MTHQKPIYTFGSLLRILIGTGTAVGVGFLLTPRHFVLTPGNGAFFFLLLGFDTSLVYAIYRSRGKQAAIGAAFLSGLILTVPFARHLLDILVITVAAPTVMVFFCDALVRWKITRPQVGRLVLLAPIFAAVGAVVSPLGLMTRPGVSWTLLMRNSAFQLAGIGLGVGLGLELAEVAIRRWHERSIPIDQAPNSHQLG